MPGLFVNDHGTWKEITTTSPQVKNGGAWMPVKEVHVHDAGVWKKVWPTQLPPTPTNLRTYTYGWNGSTYYFQSVWDPVPTAQADGYHLEVTRVGGTNPASAVIVDMKTANTWNDTFIGTTGGIVLSYRVRSYKGSTVGDWSGYLTVTTPADAGNVNVTNIFPVGDAWGHIGLTIQHDGNPQNNGWQLYGKQTTIVPDWGWMAAGAITANPMVITYTFSTGWYRGANAGNGAAVNEYSDQIDLSVWTVNTWGKPNNNANNNNVPQRGLRANWAHWCLGSPVDKYLRINANGYNVYRRQPSNSVGWVGGIPRVGGDSGDMETVYFFDKAKIAQWGIHNRVLANIGFAIGVGRRNDGGNVNVTFSVGGCQLLAGQSDPPGPSSVQWTQLTLQRLTGAQVNVPQNWNLAMSDPAQTTYGSPALWSQNSSNYYAEFGQVGENMGGWINGQLFMQATYG